MNYEKNENALKLFFNFYKFHKKKIFLKKVKKMCSHIFYISDL